MMMERERERERAWRRRRGVRAWACEVVGWWLPARASAVLSNLSNPAPLSLARSPPTRPSLFLFPQNFDIPASRTRVRLAQTNLPPRTIMRAPGTLQAVFVIEHVLETVARLTGVDGIAVRARNLLTHPLLAGPRKPCAGALAEGTTDPAANAAADAEARHVQPLEDGVAGLVLNPDGTTDEKLKSAFGADLPLDQYTVPRLWAELGESAELEERRVEVAAFNADPAHPWVKRGLAATACRFVMSVDPKPAILSVHFDGSVLINGENAR